MFCATAGGKLEHQHYVGQGSHITYGKQQSDEEADVVPRLPFKIAQFCEMWSQVKVYIFCETLSLKNSKSFRTFCKFGIRSNTLSCFFLCVGNITLPLSYQLMAFIIPHFRGDAAAPSALLLHRVHTITKYPQRMITFWFLTSLQPFTSPIRSQTVRSRMWHSLSRSIKRKINQVWLKQKW